jgi:hypothetical protein
MERLPEAVDVVGRLQHLLLAERLQEAVYEGLRVWVLHVGAWSRQSQS